MARRHHRCVGCGTQGRPGRSDRRFALYERSGDRRRGTRRIEAATAIEWQRDGVKCAGQCRAKCGRAPQERAHERRHACRERCDRQPRIVVRGKCAEVGAVADAQVPGEVHRRATGSAIASTGGGDGSRAKHAAEDAERSEASSAARSAHEGTAVPPHCRRGSAAAVEAKEERTAPPERRGPCSAQAAMR